MTPARQDASLSTRAMKLVRNNELFRTACLFAGIMCLLALVPFPMLSFAAAVRYAVSGVAVWAVFAAASRSKHTDLTVFVVVVVLFNPLFRILADIRLLRAADILSAAAFFLASSRLRPDSIGASTASDAMEQERPTFPLV